MDCPRALTVCQECRWLCGRVVTGSQPFPLTVTRLPSHLTACEARFLHYLIFLTRQMRCPSPFPSESRPASRARHPGRCPWPSTRHCFPLGSPPRAFRPSSGSASPGTGILTSLRVRVLLFGMKTLGRTVVLRAAGRKEGGSPPLGASPEPQRSPRRRHALVH